MKKQARLPIGDDQVLVDYPDSTIIVKCGLA